MQRNIMFCSLDKKHLFNSKVLNVFPCNILAHSVLWKIIVKTKKRWVYCRHGGNECFHLANKQKKTIQGTNPHNAPKNARSLAHIDQLRPPRFPNFRGDLLENSPQLTDARLILIGKTTKISEFRFQIRPPIF